MSKVVVSECCQAGIQHFPNSNLDPMNKVIFFCNKCGKTCKTKILKEEDKKK